MRNIFPIERMIDLACGYDSLTNARLEIRLRCPNCGKRIHAWRQETDPKSTVAIVAPCPDCVEEVFDPHFYDADGKEVFE